MSLDTFVHRWVPSPAGDARTLLLLHGTGGDERDLLPLGPQLDPHAALLSPRGRVLENGAPRFFRRLAEGVFDPEDLARRTDEMAAWLAAAADGYGFDAGRVVAVGFSNGANLAASLLLRHPQALAGAVLFRAMVPFEPASPPRLDGRRVFLAAGRVDPLIPAAGSERLATILRGAGAEVTLRWADAGHGLLPGEVAAAREWLGERPEPR